MKCLVSIVIALAITLPQLTAANSSGSCPSALNKPLKRLHSTEMVNPCDYFESGKPLLIVNTASHCGYTKQFSGLEKLFQTYKHQGLVILGFPSNSFNQEESSEEGTARICFKNFGVTFPMFSHVNVTGKDAHPIFQYLSRQTQEPQWNFNKYLLINGKISHFDSPTSPLDSPLEQSIKLSF